jgi:putative phosphoribosyl transferase
MHKEMLEDRKEAGLLLSEKLKKYQNSNTVILAVPKGGVPVGYTIAQNLHLPLDVVLSKKIGHPDHPEFAIGAVSIDSVHIDSHSDVSKAYLDDAIIQLKKSLKEKHTRYRNNSKPLDIRGKNVILVDDGIATGNTLLLSIAMLRKENPAKIIVAVPVLPYDALATFQQNTDELIYLIASKNFRAVGQFYEAFEQVDEEEIIRMLNLSNPIE